MRSCGLFNAALVFRFAALVSGTNANVESNSINVNSFFIITPLVLILISPDRKASRTPKLADTLEFNGN
jgi:hypothetical protein